MQGIIERLALRYLLFSFEGCGCYFRIYSTSLDGISVREIDNFFRVTVHVLFSL